MFRQLISSAFVCALISSSACSDSATSPLAKNRAPAASAANVSGSGGGGGAARGGGGTVNPPSTGTMAGTWLGTETIPGSIGGVDASVVAPVSLVLTQSGDQFAGIFKQFAVNSNGVVAGDISSAVQGKLVGNTFTSNFVVKGGGATVSGIVGTVGPTGLTITATWGSISITLAKQ